MAICGGGGGSRASTRSRHFHGQSVRRKIVLVGDGGCGKTSLLNVFTRGFFPKTYEPTVFENYVHDVMVDEELIELSLWDTAGQEGFDQLRALSYVDAHAFLLCFSVDDRDSLDNIPNRWLEEVTAHSPHALITLVGLKCDLRSDSRIVDPITYEEGRAVAQTIHSAGYVECSAMHNRGVRECFEKVARAAIQVEFGNTRGSRSCVIL